MTTDRGSRRGGYVVIGGIAAALVVVIVYLFVIYSGLLPGDDGEMEPQPTVLAVPEESEPADL